MKFVSTIARKITLNEIFTVVSDNKLSRLASSRDSHFLQELPEGSDLSYLDRGRIQKTKVAQKRGLEPRMPQRTHTKT